VFKIKNLGGMKVFKWECLRPFTCAIMLKFGQNGRLKMRKEKEKPRKDPKLSSSFTKILEQRMENVELIILPNMG